MFLNVSYLGGKCPKMLISVFGGYLLVPVETIPSQSRPQSPSKCFKPLQGKMEQPKLHNMRLGGGGGNGNIEHVHNSILAVHVTVTETIGWGSPHKPCVVGKNIDHFQKTRSEITYAASKWPPTFHRRSVLHWHFRYKTHSPIT